MKVKPIDRERLNEVLAMRRKEAGSIRPNLTSLAELIGYSEVAVLRRQLRTGFIRADYLDKIGAYLNVSPEYLSGENDMRKDNNNRQVKRALRTLHDFCYSHERCGLCPFSELRDDLGFTCRVLDIVDDDRFLKAVSDVPDQTVTISSGTIQYQPWEEFDDDL